MAGRDRRRGSLIIRAASTRLPLRLGCLTVTNAFAALRLLLMSDRDKDAEIPALRRRLTVLERQFGDQGPRFRRG
ncbi:hypothetical protein [Embleya sp. NBC_00896]|uniref:hypothetical protein n=1 Tax=Embleya sp. NBC_00896 TaxID=2975961 RepID=UPI002F9077D1|nr:hypothetical protein OG928_45325 [Embleya sp. NBC_00896]